MSHTRDTVRKGKVIELAVQQSQAAQALTRALRAHGWKTRWDGGEFRPATDEDRQEWAQRALDWARNVERNTTATRTWVEAWAKREGAK